MGNANELSTECAETSVEDGIAFIESASPLTRLHYFDGKFLKADALSQEQAYHRTRVRLSNQAGGWGVVNGLGIDVIGNELIVDGGLAITPAGNFVMNVAGVKASLDELLKIAEKAPPEGNADFQPCVTELGKSKGTTTTTSGLQIYEITVGPIDTLCGNEPVYGKLCESACVSDSRHPYWREGMVLRLRPISLKLPSSATPLTSTHLRNRIASAYFALEPGSTSDLLSRAGLQGDGWCATASLYGRDEVAIGLLTRDGTAINVDSWAARRERMDSQARGYWQGRMAMRPWNVYLAQILQFQCQLSGVLDDQTGVVKPASDCDELRVALDKARKEIAALQKKYAASSKQMVERFAGRVTKADTQWAIDESKVSGASLYELSDSLSKLEVGSGALPANRLLLNSGFQQLPPAGYLPIEPSKTTVSEQLSRMFGEGVRLHLRAARADVLPHLLEEAQHMERISLTKGLDNPKDLEDVEVFIPDGQLNTVAAQTEGIWWQTTAVAPVTSLMAVMDDMEMTTDSKDIKNNFKALIDAAANRAKKARMLAESGGGAIEQAAGTRNVSSVITHIDDVLQQDGLTRTEAREDGTFGLTAVVSIDLLDAQTLRAEQIDASNVVLSQAETPTATAAPEPKASDASGLNVEPGATEVRMLKMGNEAATAEMTQVVIARLQEVATYVAADIATDPFGLSVGEDARIKLEWMTMFAIKGALSARYVRADGDLTIERIAKKGSQTTLYVQLDITGTQVFYEDGGKTPHSVNGSIRLALVRQGDGRTGVLLIDDAQANPDTPEVEVDWSSAPQTATVSLINTAAQDASSQQVLQLLGDKPDAQPVKQSSYMRINSGMRINQTTDQQRDEVLNLAALPAMPATSSAIGASAMNALTTLSDFLNDAAFLARASARLFPQPKSSRNDVTALHDWVMFRRMRPAFCNDVIAAAPTVNVEAFQVWHLKLRSNEELQYLLKAMKAGHDEVFLKLQPKRVGVLRYQDENTASEESPARVLAMWKQAKPGAQVALARVWETTPEAGQGWQNHFRVREMLDEISTLTKPPAAGNGAIATLKEAPGPLADGATEGGMLVVTIDKEETETTVVPHRVIMVPFRVAESLYKVLKVNPQGGWAELKSYLTNPPTSLNLITRDLLVHFDKGVLSQADQDALKKAKEEIVAKEIVGVESPSVYVAAVRLDADKLATDVKPAAQHEMVSKVLAANIYDVAGGPNVFQLTDTDLGGAQVVSLVFVNVSSVN